MKKSTLKLCLLLLGFLGIFSTANAQKKQLAERGHDHSKCGTMDHLESLMKQDPALRASYNKSLSDAANRAQQTASTARDNNTSRLNAIVTIPVVVHIVLPNPNVITDGDVYEQIINRLNLDYSGLNPDSTNATGFYNIRGHCQLRFCLAKRDQNGAFTNGIERRASNTTYSTGGTDPIKSTATGGLDTWGDSYFNVWVGSGGGLLGYATFPGTSTPAQQGMVIDAVGFGSNPCTADPNFNLGRTLSHEAGHFFGLYHIWGDDGSACTGDDFRQLPGTAQFPPALLIGDTPNQAGPTSGCPTGVRTDACNASAPGINYQNYMDYTNDACYSMFTNQQAARMEWVVDNIRTNLKTSMGCTPPANAILLDAALTNIVSPGGTEVIGNACVSNPVPTCAGPFVPKIRISNRGASAITSVRFGLILNGGAAVSQIFNVALATGQSTVLALPTQNVITGANTLKYFVGSPNGGTDQNVTNDTLNTTINISAGVNIPIAESFINTGFPPANFTIFNPNNNTTWVRNANGRNSVGSAFIDNYNNQAQNQFDDLRTAPLNVGVTDSLIITFDLAHKNYPAAAFSDTLRVMVSNNCGATFTDVYKKWGATLATAGSSTAGYTTPAANDWRNERIAIAAGSFANSPVIIAFRDVNRYGNNVFLDNINIEKKVNRDLKVDAVLRPNAAECVTTLTPQITVRNNGAETITSYTAGYILDNNAAVTQNITTPIAPGATVNISLAALTSTPGNHSIKGFTGNPVSASGTGDLQQSNDTLTMAFVINTLATAAIRDDFEGQTFPSTGWSIINPNNNVTWIRRSPGRASANAIFIDNYNNDLVSQTDRYVSPTLQTVGTDSVIITFDLAHKNYPGSNDVLTVLVSTNCGQTFTPVFTRQGATLATAGSSTANYIAPIAADWRTQKISLSGAQIAGGSIIVAIQNTNDYGNNIFIDNINIQPVFSRDLQLVSIDQPNAVVCTPTFTPRATFRNVGVQTITGYKVAYSVDNGAPVVATVTGVSIARDSVVSLNLAAATIASVGAHTIRVYTADPVTASGTGDANITNDTLTKAFSLVGTSAAPLVEGFEATVPPTNWGLVNSDNNITWSKSAVARTGTGSAFVRNFAYTFNKQKDDLYSPIVTYSGVDSLFLSFDLSAANRAYPGATMTEMDTLEVLVTKDCGNSFTTVYKKWGAALQTIDDPNGVQSDEYRPNAGQWRTERVNLSAFAPAGPLQFVFRNTTNNQNNVYVDNVNLSTKTLAAKLKANGYMLSPNPFTNMFMVQHQFTPTELRGIGVYNSIGQRVTYLTFNGNADNNIPVDMSAFPAGIYVIKLEYTNKTISDKVLKVTK